MSAKLVAFASRLACSPLPARMLALGGMLSALTLALVALGVDGATAWDARIGLLLGVGATMLALPKWLGWPDRTLNAVVVAALFLVLSSRLLLLSLPAPMAWAWRANEIVLLLLLGSCLLILLSGFLRRNSSLLGTLASALGGLLLVGSGAEAIGIALMAWADLAGAEAGALSALLLAACALWALAFGCNRWEARRPYGEAGRLLALRSLLLRLGGVAAGTLAGLSMLPAVSSAAWTAAFDTPLEGLASAMGYVVATLAGLLVAATFAVLLPRLLARLQLSGLLAASAAGETGWFAALALLLPIAGGVLLPLAVVAQAEPSLLPAFTSQLIAYVWALVGTTLAHSLIRLLLGRVSLSSAVPLWLYLPENAPAPATLEFARCAARTWSLGPVTLVAPAPVALRVRGTHLRLAQQAGLLPALFASNATQGAEWRRMRLPADEAWSGLPFSELYGGDAAWRAGLAESKAGSRILVIVGASPPSWEAGFFAALPAGSELLMQQAEGGPAGGAGVRHDRADFSRPTIRSEWLAHFGERHAPPSRPLRRVLIVHQRTEQQLAQRLATALGGQFDAAGRQVLASTLDAQPPSASLLLAVDGRTLETLVCFAARFGASLGRAPDAGFQARLSGWVAALLASTRPAKLQLIVLEAAAGATDRASTDAPLVSSTARGLESDADAVISLLPADAATGLSTLYAAAAYTDTLRLPPPSALDERSIAELARRLLSDELIAGTSPDERANKSFESIESEPPAEA